MTLGCSAYPERSRGTMSSVVETILGFHLSVEVYPERLQGSRRARHSRVGLEQPKVITL
jgi:hypothetical protein